MGFVNNPAEAIVPIISISQETGRAFELYGTAFFVRPQVLMSAHHVVGVDPPDGRILAAVYDTGDLPVSYPIDVSMRHEGHDIGLARVPDWPSDAHLDIATEARLWLNGGVFTMEYSPSDLNHTLPDGRKAMMLSTNNHQGHVVRIFDCDLHDRPSSCLNVSYPAIRRASGAPVCRADSGEVVGMIVANVATELAPFHIETVLTEDNTLLQEIQYRLPYGHGYWVKHLRDAFDNSGAVAFWPRRAD